MSVFKERVMQSRLRKEHLDSIRDKFDDLMVSYDFNMQVKNMDRLLKALTVYVLKGGVDDDTE